MADINSRYKYVFHHVLTRAFLGEFLIRDVAFNSPLKGAGGQFNGTIPISRRQTAEVVQAATGTDEAAVYVIYQDPDTNVETFLWGGIVVGRTWMPRSKQVKIEAVEWKSWFYTKEFSPSLTPPYANRKLTYTGIEQLLIARALLLDATGYNGAPAVTLPLPVSSGILRDLSLNGYDHKFIGDVVDTMANRTDGFDWDITVTKNVSDKLPELVGNFYYPEKGTVQGLTLDHVREAFDRGQDGRGNILDYGDWPESSVNRRTRVWATGTGTPPDQPVAMDDDPDIDTDLVLLRETMINRSSVSSPATLSEHAQAERAYLGVKTESVDVALKANMVKPTDFIVGDRVALQIRDGWLDIDETAIRVVDRAIAPHNSSDGERIVATLDLSDATEADPDTGDTV